MKSDVTEVRELKQDDYAEAYADFTANFDGKKKDTQWLKEYAKNNNVPYGWVEGFYKNLEPRPKPMTILNKLKAAEEHQYQRSKKGRLQGGSAGAYGRDMNHSKHTINILRREMVISIIQAYKKGELIPYEVFTYNYGMFEYLKKYIQTAQSRATRLYNLKNQP